MSNYIVKENNKMILATSDYMLGCSTFLAKVKEVIRDNFGLFGNVGLPYSLEAYLCVDDKICNSKKLIKKADEILNLFKQIQTFDGSIVHKNYLGEIQFSNDEWNLKFEAKDGIAIITSKDGVHYLKTNIFNNLKEKNQLYFRYCLEKVVSTPSKILKLGEEAKYEITINKCN